jgi:hypothetical protein
MRDVIACTRYEGRKGGRMKGVMWIAESGLGGGPDLEKFCRWAPLWSTFDSPYHPVAHIWYSMMEKLINLSLNKLP